MRTPMIVIALLLVPALADAQTPPPDNAPPPEAAQPEIAPLPEEAPPPEVATTPASEPKRAPWTFGIAVRAGLDVPTAKLSPMAAGRLELDFATPAATHRLVIALGFGLTQVSHDGTVSDPRVGGMRSYTVDEAELAIGLDVVFRVFGTEKKLVPWIGVGPVLHLLKTSETSMIAPGTNTEQSTEIGGEIVGGVDLRAGPGYAVGDVRFVYSGLDHTITGKVNAGNAVVSVGYRLVF